MYWTLEASPCPCRGRFAQVENMQSVPLSVAPGAGHAGHAPWPLQRLGTETKSFPRLKWWKTQGKPLENSRKGWIDLGFNNNSTSLFGACYTVLNNFIGCGMMWNQLGLQVWKSHWFSPPTLTKWDWVLPVRSLYRKGYLKILESQFIPCWIHSNLKAASHVMNVMKPSCS